MRLTKMNWVMSAAVALFAAVVMILWILNPLAGGVFRDTADIIGAAFSSPIALAFPLVFVVPVIGLIARPTTHRFVGQLWTRGPMRRTLVLWATRVSGTSMATTAISFGLVAAFVLLLVPRMYPRAIDPGAYEMTAAEAQASLLDRFNFGVFGAGGYETFAALFVALLTLQAGIYALLALGCAVRWGRPTLAVFAPMALYMGMTVLVAFIGHPAFAPLHAVAPFGLVRTGEWQPLVTLVVVAGITLAIWFSILSDPRRAEALA